MPIKFQVNISRQAERDIEEIWKYIAADSQVEASKFIHAFENQITTLEQLPNRCPMIPENELFGTQNRHLIYGDYRTVFRVSDKTVHILRVVHGARLLDVSMFET